MISLLRWLAVSLAAPLAPAAFALNHTVIAPPLGAGSFHVACSNVAQDTGRIIAGATPTDYWEGNLVNNQLLYVDQILSAPGTAIRFDAIPPNDRSIYPNTANARVPYVAIVCHPTPATNADPDYPLPGSTDVVPKMQPAGAAPKLVPGRMPLIVYSHGLGGSPVGKGYVQSIALLASHGYVVAAVFHADARFSRLKVEDLGDYWYLLTQYDRVAEMMLMRPVSLKAMVDVMLAHPQYGPAIDADRIGGFGASLGGQAMANLLGAKLTTSISKSCRETVRDPRIKVAFTFVPYAGQSFLPAFCDDQNGADEVTRPFFAMSGTADTTAPIKLVRQAVNRFKGSRYMVELVDGEHELRAEDIGDLFRWMVTFYRAYLENDPAALAAFFKIRGVSGGREDTLTIDAHVPSPIASGDVIVTELHNPSRDLYFLESDSAEAAEIVAAGLGWNRSGHAFKAYANPPAPSATACHFGGTRVVNSEAYRECNYAKRLGRWTYHETGDFYIEKADALGQCRDGLLQVNRLFNPRYALSRTVSSERFVTSDSEARNLVDNGWVLLPTTMCARP